MRPCTPRIALALLLVTGCGPKDAPIESAADAAEDVGGVTEEPVVDEGKAVLREMKGEPLHERVNHAAALLRSGTDADLVQARALLDQAAAEAPDSAEVHFNLGVLAYHEGDVEAAERKYQQALDLDDAFGPAWLQLGVLEEQDGDLEQALVRYRTGIERAPENEELRVALIGVLRKLGRVDEAIVEAKDALRINAKSTGVYNNLGLAYMERGDLALAKFVYVKALSSIPEAGENPYILTNLGWVYVQLGDKVQAEKQLTKAVELDPDLLPGLVYLSYLYMENRNYDAIVPLLERARDQDPDNPSLLVNLGIAYRGVGRTDDAKKMYEAALEHDPDYAAPWFNLGIVLGDYDKAYDEAIAAFQSYVDGGGDQAERAKTYMDDLAQEKERAERRRQREEERKKREKEREERQRLLEEAARKEAEAAAAEGTDAGDTAPADDASDTEAPAPELDASGEGAQ